MALRYLAKTLFPGGAQNRPDDILVALGDKVVVPRAGILYVICEVNRPGGFVMRNDGHLTLLQAVAMALGTRNTASINKAGLIRKTETGCVDSAVPLGRILNRKSSDLQRASSTFRTAGVSRCYIEGCRSS